MCHFKVRTIIAIYEYNTVQSVGRNLRHHADFVSGMTKAAIR